MLLVLAQAVSADEARRREDLGPLAVGAALVHRDGSGGLVHAQRRHDEQLRGLLVLGGGQGRNPFGRLFFMLDEDVQLSLLLCGKA